MTLFTPPFQTTLDANANPVSGARLMFYVSGTSTPAPVYADVALTTPLPSPVIADAAGRFVPIYLKRSIQYRVVVQDAAGTTIRDVDPVVDSSLIVMYSVAQLKAFSGDNGGAILATPDLQGVYTWRDGDYSSLINDKTYIASTTVPSTEGAWVLLNKQEPSNPAIAAATAADWASLPSLQRALAAAHRNPGTVTIKIVGVGDSNGLGAGVSPENAPVVVAARTAQEALDPTGVAIWVTENYSVNGRTITGYFEATSESDLTTPAEYVEASDATVVVAVFTANDPAVEIYNGALGADAMYSSYIGMLEHINAQDADAVVVTSPHAHVDKAKELDDYGRSSLMLLPSLSMVYPNGGSFKIGRTNIPGNEVNFTFAASSKRITVNSHPGIFASTNNGFGLSIGKRIEVLLPTGAADPTNGGIYSIAAIDASGNWIQLDREWTFAPTTMAQWTDAGPASLTDGTYSATIQRIDIDPETELSPTVDDGWQNFDYSGSGDTIPVLTRYLAVNGIRRRAVRNLAGRALTLDMEASWFQLVALNGEDRYYAENEVVHWNNYVVTDPGGMEDTWRQFWRSLTAVQRSVSAYRASSQPDIVVRPSLNNLATLAEVDAESSVDLQVASGERHIMRNSEGKAALWLTDAFEPKVYERFFDADFNVAFAPYRQRRCLIGSAAQDFAIPDGHYFYGHAIGYRNDLGSTIYRVAGCRIAGTLTLTASIAHDAAPSLDVMSVGVNGANLRVTPPDTSAPATYFLDLTYQPLAYEAT